MEFSLNNYSMHAKFTKEHDRFMIFIYHEEGGFSKDFDSLLFAENAGSL